MSFFPVVERELRVLSRTRRLYWGRFSAALLALVMVAWFWFTFVRISSSNAAGQIFGTLGVLAFAYCLLAGIFLTADCVSEEKREGTLGLLFLTDLKGYDVAFGKLTANSLQAVYNLLSIFPILTIPLLLGGLAASEVLRMALVLLNTLAFSLTLGLLASTVSKQDRKAQVAAFSMTILVTALLPAAVAFLQRQYRIPLSDGLYALSPAYTVLYTFDQKFKTDPHAFWWSLALVHLLSWAAFLVSAVLMPRVWQDQPQRSEKVGWRDRYLDWKRGAAAVRQRYRAALLQSNPYLWLIARDRLKPYYVLWFLGGCAIFWFLLWWHNRRDMLEQEAFFATALVLRTVLKIWVAMESGRQIFEDRRTSAIELTLSTPLPVHDILEGQFLALLRQFGPAVALVLLFDLLGMAIAGRVRFGSDSELLLTWVATIIVFLVDTATLSTLGMWLGLTSKRFSRAVARNLFFVLVLPWIIFFGLIAYMALARLPALNSLNFIIGIYFLISVVTDLVLFLNASGNLTTRFRDIATQRFESVR